ncbi:LTA synthase family protein [Ornithinibacillus halophilus]|uniref:Phosphoglycerol transferase MdoB n=1 Tax=Ornithinibacillus halophilus TaxID=930117 RepID=A0A1M5IK29_9BACI|nr:alkaline phosphatase family protein [Ornithinibacillus halophilus]SHG28714.1 Phosphoglycerol transferase MdoB [Ornithinibacillus halophilus]
MKITDKYVQVAFILLSLLYMELILRIAVENHMIHVFSKGVLVTLLFSISLSFLIVAITSIFHPKLNFVLHLFFLLIVTVIFSSQVIYHDIFRTFYNFFSVGHAGQAMEFSHTAMDAIGQNIIWIILLFLPFLFQVILGEKIFSFERVKLQVVGMFVAFFVLIHISGVGLIISGKNIEEQAYEMYFNETSPNLSVEKLGLFTTMRIDLQRYITKWSPTVEAPVFADGIPEEKEEPEKNVVDDEPVDEEEESSHIPEPNTEEYGFNVLDIDFDQLISEEKNEDIKNMHHYFQSVEPTKKNEFTGKFEGYNLIMLTAEGYAPYAVQKEVTPTLYKMVNEGYQFNNFYVPLWDVSTSDGEYVALNGIIPKPGVWSFSRSSDNEVPFVFGNQLKNIGYATYAYHNHTYDYYDRDLSHPNMGYDYKGVGNGLHVTQTWPESDLEMMEETIDEYINKEPFHAYYMTVSGHLEYNFGGNNMAHKNKKYVETLDYSEQAKAYLATQIELDRALQYLIEKLTEAGVMERTLIVLSADHYPYGLEFETIDELSGKKVDQDFGIYKSNLIVYTEDMEKTEVDKPMSSLDILPTISNLLGLEYDSRLLMGTDVFSDAPSLVMFRNKSFISDIGKYNAITGTFTPFNEKEVEDDYVKKVSSIIDQKFYYSTKILDENYYEKVMDVIKD